MENVEPAPPVSPFPQPPRGRRGGLYPLITAFVVGTGALFASIEVYWDGYIPLEYLLAAVFSSMLLVAFSARGLMREFSIRKLWNTGEVIPAIVLAPAKCRPVSGILVSMALAMSGTAIMLVDWLFVPGVLCTLLISLLGRLFGRLNSAQVYFESNGESLIARVPMLDRWRSFDVGDAFWIACIGRRVAAVHAVAPANQEVPAITQGDAEWLERRLDAFIDENDSE